ncbi:hypothetical protein K2173_010731 [Erythroxylum novogranatense]|uniref:Receptor-like serine/threonine-protein kinase n=1 Tax=Erythroxylum novogranatense TaxID=1862640 RepID=A0AAV8SRH6_9ROSI|nr:hypothetical protein K2173_010731 [Erythroxylum novogranatense]
MSVSIQGQGLLLLFSIILSSSTISAAVDVIRATQKLTDGETLVSSGGNFELGFFRPGNSRKRYLGIWYKKISKFTVVWVANGNNPLNDSSGVIKFVDQSNFVLLNGTNGTVWSASSSAAVINPLAQLLDTGNLVVRNENDKDRENFLWQSFDYPSDTFLPGMKYGINLQTGLNRVLTSWRSPDDPSTGHYINKLNPNGRPQFYLFRDSVVEFRSGSWNGLRFSGMINLEPNPIYKFDFISNKEEIYYQYELINSSVLSRMVLSPQGSLERFTWIDRTQEWSLYLTASMDNCDRFDLCGPNGVCDINNSPACGCLKWFVPKSTEEWIAADWSNGCARKVPLECTNGEGFIKYPGIKLPDTQQSRSNETMNLEECEKVCLKNCSCTAYANTDIRNGGSGCILWFGDLIDIRKYSENGQDIYIRLAASVMDDLQRSEGKKRVKIIVVPISLVGSFLLALCIFFYVLRRKRKHRRRGTVDDGPKQDQTTNEDFELPLFEFASISEATNCFSIKNIIGQGGFGPVYKGILKDGQVIAVKRLSKRSRQGVDQFKNEVICIAKLQHRNLVKLLGCCIQHEERILIYEYMPNKSLDYFIFDKRGSMVLDWSKRFHILNGIARGLLYLHHDSRIRIIHRDLKASNILLDYQMNPKISDFGMARSFGGDETSANTSRIVGTYGYMSPEYAIDGLFSLKSDVFSFGVLALEILSGRKNRRFSHIGHKFNLLGHAWMLHREDRCWELVEESFKGSCIEFEVLRAIRVGLLCVQQSPEDRPNMSTVVLMLTTDIALPEPKEPGFFAERDLLDADSSSTKHETSSTNELTLTKLDAR